MAMMVRQAVAERNYQVPQMQARPPPRRTQFQVPAVADNIYVPVQSFPPPPPPPLALEYSDNVVKPPQKANYYVVVEVVLRIFLFVFSLAALLILLTSKQTIEFSTPGDPSSYAPFSLKFNTYSPAFKLVIIFI